MAIGTAGIQWLTDRIAEWTTIVNKLDVGNSAHAATLAGYVTQEPIKRATATAIRALVSGGTVTNPGILAELTADADALDHRADIMAEYISRNTPGQAAEQSRALGIHAAIDALQAIVDAET